MTEWHNQRRVRTYEPFRCYIIRCSWDRKDLFFPAVQIQRKDILSADLCPDDPGVVLVSVPAGKEESRVDIQRPTDGFPVVCASFRLSAVDDEFFRVISQSIVDLLNLRIGSAEGQLLKQVCTIFTYIVIGDCIKHLEQIEELRGGRRASYEYSAVAEPPNLLE